jgi:hypothetical protein
MALHLRSTAEPLQRTVFTVGGRAFALWHVLTAASLRREDGELWSALCRGLACQSYAAEEGFGADADSLQEALDTFRYDRGLVAAEDTEAWLSDRQLTEDNLVDYVERAVWRERFTSGTDPILQEYPPSEQAVCAALWTECLCGNFLLPIAMPLAQRAAAAGAAGTPPASGYLDAARTALARLRDDSNPRQNSAQPRVESSPEWFEELVRMEAHYLRLREQILTPERMETTLLVRRLDLLKAAVQTVRLDSMGAAKEVVLCVTQDCESLATAAARAGSTPTVYTGFVDALPEHLRQPVLFAAPGDVLPPIETDDGVHVCRLADKIEPRLDDPDVQGRVQDLLLSEALASVVAAQVEWCCPLE